MKSLSLQRVHFSQIWVIPSPSPPHHHRLPLLPFLNSVHRTEHFTLLNPPSPHPCVSERGTQVICHQKGGGGGGGDSRKRRACRWSAQLGMTEPNELDVGTNAGTGARHRSPAERVYEGPTVFYLRTKGRSQPGGRRPCTSARAHSLVGPRF